MTTPRRVLVLGGGGFIGRSLCAHADALGARLSVVTRRAAHARAVQTLPWVDVLEFDVHDEHALARNLAGHDAVINLVAILHGDAAAFEHVHVALVDKLVRACRQAGVPRIVHVSALGAGAAAPSLYQRSKARGEALLAASGLELSVLRPSVVFGDGDQFLSLFARLQSVLPVLPLAGANTRFQPVWVDDVARALVALLQPRAPGEGKWPQVVEACGPDVYTLRELVRLAGRLAGHPRPVIGLPPALARLQAWVMETMPGPTLMSRDNLASLSVDNVATPGAPGLKALGIRPASLQAIAPGYLSPERGNAALALRRGAGRY